MFVVKHIVKGVSAGIGAASEVIADHKEKKADAQRGINDPHHGEGSSITPSASRDKKVAGEDSDSEEEDLDTDKAHWALDEVAAELDAPPAYSDEMTGLPPILVDDVAREFNEKHLITLSTRTTQQLPMPVIIPQRRPKNKSRGFVRAYAPVLGQCSGISQEMFIDFLNDFDKASKTSPVFDVINLACLAVGFVPNPIAMGVTIAVQTASRTAQELQERHRTNTFLDQINESMFKPRGLYAMIMTFQPDNPLDPVLRADINSTDMALAKALSNPDNQMRQKLKQIRVSSGKTQGEVNLPEAAPLVYPALDAAAASGQPVSEQKQSALKMHGAVLASYLDRRAQASYAGEHPESRLVLPPPEKKFASRFSDPNHPVNSGSWVALVTGGKYDGMAKKRVRKAHKRAAKQGIVLSEADIQNAKMGRPVAKKKGIIGKVMQKSVLYLIITNLPSESEMMEIRQEIQRIKSSSS